MFTQLDAAQLSWTIEHPMIAKLNIVTDIREMSALSLPFAAIVPIILYYAGTSPSAQWLSAALFVVRHVLTALRGRNDGIRFVASLLGIHFARVDVIGDQCITLPTGLIIPITGLDSLHTERSNLNRWHVRFRHFE